PCGCESSDCQSIIIFPVIDQNTTYDDWMRAAQNQGGGVIVSVSWQPAVRTIPVNGLPGVNDALIVAEALSKGGFDPTVMINAPDRFADQIRFTYW
ncbi:MAG: hypothetical protein NZM00_05280, partial [Anaerolinea sp.]|nr:hypothetical protein [Anaerolinea sp.]